MPCLLFFSSSLCLQFILADHVLTDGKICSVKSTDNAEHFKRNKKNSNMFKFILSQKSWRKDRGALLFLAIANSCFFQSYFVLVFLYAVHIFNPIVQFFSHSFACSRFCAKKQKKWLKKVTDRIWVKTQLLQEIVPLCLLFCVFLLQPQFCDDCGACTNSLFLFNVSSSSLCLQLMLGNHVFACMQKHGLQKSIWNTRNLNC